MAQRVYIYNKTGSDITSMTKVAPGTDSVDFDLEYFSSKILNVKDNRTSNVETLVTFQRDINDEVTKFVLHKDNKEGIVKIANDDQYNEFYKRKSIISKESEFQTKRDEQILYFHDEREVVNKAPVSILREFNLENLDCVGTQAQIDFIRNNDVTLQVTPTYYNNKLIYTLGYDQKNKLSFRVNYVYDDNGFLIRMDEFSLRKTPLGVEQYLLDASFSFKYSLDRVAYINCTGTDYKRIDLQYNAVGEFVAAYKTATAKTLWFKVSKNIIEFNSDKTVMRYRYDRLATSSVIGDVTLNYKYNATKNNVNRFVIPGILTPVNTISNLMMYNIDLLGTQPYLEEIVYKYTDMNLFKLIPEYRRDKISSLGIYDHDSMTKLGFVRYFYTKNLVTSIDTYYYDKNNNPVWVNTFSYNRNPYNPNDRTLKVEHDCIGEGEFKIGKYTFKMTKDFKISTIYDNYSKLKIAQVTYDKNNDVESYDQLTTDFPVDISDFLLSEYFEIQGE